MFIKKFQLFNYKSYLDSGFLEFSPGINIIIGQNNSGKTALLEALSLTIPNKPHRSIRNLPNPFSRNEEESYAEVQLFLEKEELQSLMVQIPSPIGIPIPSNYEVPDWSGDTVQVEWLVGIFKKWLDNSEPVELNLKISSNRQFEIEGGQITRNLTFGLYQYYPEKNKDGQYIFIKLVPSSPDAISPSLVYPVSDGPYGKYIDPNDIPDYESFTGYHTATIAYKIFELFRSRIYRFHAERLHVGECAYGNNADLKPNASNLAEVLYLLPNKNPLQFHRLNEYISTIFPGISGVSVTNTNNSVLAIKVWTLEATEYGREDLTLSLSECGTGLSQVLAILYVVITSRFPRTIIIDEPQSFLHPGAAKKLIEILKEFSQHQYFIATHSPMLITAANPTRILRVIYEECQTKVLAIEPHETIEQQAILADVGVRLSDVFGADSIFWVEGPTEERCFPLILAQLAKKSLQGTVILAIQAVGDLEGRRSEVIFDIYNRLSGSKSLLPPAIGFVLDRELRTKNDIESLTKRSRHLISFLPRRMYENYLLESEALATLINKEDQDRETALTSLQIEKWINQKKQEGLYLKGIQNKAELSELKWLEKVDAASLLGDLFNELSEARVVFSKTKHSYDLTEWLIQNKPNYLMEVASFLLGIFDK